MFAAHKLQWIVALLILAILAHSILPVEIGGFVLPAIGA
jgi:hypothetical protein